MDISSQDKKLTLNAANEYVERFCADNEIAMGHTMKLSLIVEELATNTLEHGGAPDSPITMELSHSADFITLRYSDRGVAFDPMTDLDDASTVDGVEGTVGGWGWPLIKRYCETITYGRENDENRLTMMFSLSE